MVHATEDIFDYLQLDEIMQILLMFVFLLYTFVAILQCIYLYAAPLPDAQSSDNMITLIIVIGVVAIVIIVAIIIVILIVVVRKVQSKKHNNSGK